MRFLFCLLFLPLLLTGATPDSNKVYEAIRVAVSPKIDGQLNDEAWQKANILSGFIQNTPYEGHPVTQQTEVKITYDDYALYIGAMMYDTAPDSIKHELGARDDGNVNSDFFRILIDPYNKRQDAFDFSVSAAGVQLDSKFSDPTFDAVWESAVKITDKGWIAEFKIPYSAIRFPKQEVQKWALEFTRSIRRNREYDQWALIPNGKANPLQYFGTLNGISNIKTPIRLSFTPYVSSLYAKVPVTNADGTSGYGNANSYSIGSDLKYGIDDRFTIDMTLLPDFSQVQSDNKIKTLGYREVVYDENRPFFKEGVELFNKGDLFYSRRIGKQPSGYSSVAEGKETVINNPQQARLMNAFKLSGRTNAGTGIGVLNAFTANTYATVKDSLGEEKKILTEPLTNFNIVVLDQQLKNNSSVYFINTNTSRELIYNNSNVTGTGFYFENKKNIFAISGKGALSQNFSKQNLPDSKLTNIKGYNYVLEFEKVSGNFQFSLRREVMDNKFDTHEMGYQTIGNDITHNGNFRYNIYSTYKFLRNSYNNINIGYSNNYLTGKRTGLEINLNSYSTLLNFHSFFFGAGGSPLSNYDYNEPRTQGRYSFTTEYYYVFAGISSDYRKRFAIDMSFNFADLFKNNSLHYTGDATYYEAKFSPRFRVNDKLSFIYNLFYSVDNYNPGFATKTDNEIVYGGRKINTVENIISTKLSFTNKMFLTLRVRHYWNSVKYKEFFILQEDGKLVNSPTDYNVNSIGNFFNADLLYSWQFAPGSFLTFAYKNAIDYFSENFESNGYLRNLKKTLISPQINSVSVRLIYYLDYLYFKKLKNS